jgi:hypothetical protein
MSNHVEGCVWEKHHNSVTTCPPIATFSNNHEYLSIEENMSHYKPADSEPETIIFHYCPVCGCEL